MDLITQRLKLKFDELNVLEVILSAGGFDADYARQKFRDALEDAYIEGFAAAEYQLQTEEDIEEELLLLALDKSYDGVSIYEKFDNYYADGDANRMRELIEDEYHRAYSQGSLDMAKGTGRQVYKTWVTMMDDRVRESHDYLEGMTIPISEKFVTLDMDEADAPGGFSLPEHNCGCRCLLTYSYE